MKTTIIYEAPQVLIDFLGYMQTVKGKSPKTVDEYYIDLRFPEKQEYSLSKWAVEGDNAVYLVTFNGDLLVAIDEQVLELRELSRNERFSNNFDNIVEKVEKTNAKKS